MTALPIALVAALTIVPPVSSQEGLQASVLIDFGDGYSHWADVTLGDNRTAVKATELAAEQLGMTIEVTWSEYGAFVADIDGRDPAFPEAWVLYSWEVDRWSLAQVGASDLELGQGDSVAWMLTRWDESFQPVREPEGTPDHRYPVVSFRGGQDNKGRFQAAFAGDPALAWSFDTSAFEISATPVASGGTVFVATWDGTYALDLDSGGFLWTRGDVSGMSTPAIYNGNVLLGAADGRLHYLDGGTGSEIWNVTLVEEEYVAFTGVASSPKIVGSTAYVGAFNESGGDGGVYAVSMVDGSVTWRHPTGSVHQSSPAIHGGALFVGVAGHFQPGKLTFGPPFGLLALAADDGALLWFYETEGAVTSSPAYDDGTVMFTSTDGYLYAVAADAGNLRWKRPIGRSTSSPAVSGGTVYAGSGTFTGGGSVYAFDSGGEELWRTELSGGVQSSIAVADGRVYVATNEAEGRAVCLDAADGRVLWSLTPKPAEYILSSPVLTDGTLLVASDNGILYAYRGAEVREVPLELVLVPLGGLAVAFLAIVLWRGGRR